MTVRQEKRRMRREVVASVRAIPPEAKAARDLALLGTLPDLPGFAAAGSVLLYASAFPEEVDTRPMLRLALDRGKRLILPRVDRERKRLVLVAIDDPGRDLATGTLGIAEPAADRPTIDPSAVDWVLVPGVALDRRGGRLGRGGGYYDRLLQELRPDAPRWALAYDEQVVPTVPTEPHDRRVDGLATPSGLLDCSAP